MICQYSCLERCKFRSRVSWDIRYLSRIAIADTSKYSVRREQHWRSNSVWVGRRRVAEAQTDDIRSESEGHHQRGYLGNASSGSELRKGRKHHPGRYYGELHRQSGMPLYSASKDGTLIPINLLLEIYTESRLLLWLFSRARCMRLRSRKDM